MESTYPGREPGAAESPGETLRERRDLYCVLKAKWGVHSERAGGLSDGGLSCVDRTEHGTTSGRGPWPDQLPRGTGGCWITVCAGKLGKRMLVSHGVMARGLCSQMTWV